MVIWPLALFGPTVGITGQKLCETNLGVRRMLSTNQIPKISPQLVNHRSSKTGKILIGGSESVLLRGGFALVEGLFCRPKIQAGGQGCEIEITAHHSPPPMHSFIVGLFSGPEI